MVDKIENVGIEASTFLKNHSNILWLIVSLLMLQFVLKCMLLRKYKMLIYASVSNIWFVRFMEVKFHLRTKVVSALDSCLIESVRFVEVM